MTVSNIAATGFNPTPVTQTLGNMVDLARGIQGYQIGQQTQQGNAMKLQGAAIDLQVQQQANKERQAVMQLMKTDPKAKPGPDGTFDMSYLNQVLPQIAPQTWAEQIQRIGSTNQNTLKANSDQMNYNAAQQADIANILKENYGKAPSEISANLDDAEQQFPKLSNRIEMIRHQLTQVEPTNQEGINAILAHNVGITQTLQQQLQLQQAQKELKTPTLASTGGGLISVSPESATGIPQFKQVAATTLSPGQVESIETDPATQQAVVVRRAANGSIVSARPASAIGGGGNGVGGGGKPPNSAFTNIPPGENLSSQKELMDYRAGINTAAQQTGGLDDNLSQISDLADKIIAGKPGQVSSNIARLTGYRVGDDPAANNQRLGHYLALTTAQLANQMGIRGTDAGGEQAAQLVGKQDWDPQALKSTADTVRAYNTGVKLQNQGLETYLKDKPIFAARQFRDAWSQNFSVDALRLYNAASKGQQAYQNEVADLGGTNSPQFAEAQRRAAALKMLKNGQLPQQ